MTDPGPNILLSSAGRRVQLVRFFQRALAGSGLPGRVLVSEANPEWSAAARIADGWVRTPPVRAPEYRAALLELVQRERIGLLIPTIDTELAPLAGLRDRLAGLGCHAVVSTPELVAIGRDKRRSDRWFQRLGFQTPRLYQRDALEFPCFVKPFDGSLSRGAQALLSPAMLAPHLLEDDSLLFMEYLGPDQYDEFTVDAYYDREGTLRCLVPRKRIEVRGGEISKGVALKGRTYDYLRQRLVGVEGARGCLTFQFFVSQAEDRVLAIEVNPRFGGGYPLSHAAGADYPGWLVGEYLVNRPVGWFDGWRDRTAMARYDEEVIFTLPEPA
jgi:carbamoyl-phosphate synthase large subunit